MQTFFRITSVVIVVLIASSAAFASSKHGSVVPSTQKAVLVTGASTGIGRKITEVLATKGYFVYAGARKQKDLDALNKLENVQSIRLDVTIQKEIDAAVETVRNGGRGLHGIVNNAGVASFGPLIEVKEEDVKWLFDINVFGVLRMNQAFAPLIIENKGRIVTTGSIAGINSGPFLGSYNMSKHAIEAYTDALAVEMMPFGVNVSVIEPGAFKSEIINSAFKKIGGMNEQMEKSPYADVYRARLNSLPATDSFKEPDAVADAAVHALFDDHPKRRYMVMPSRENAHDAMKKLVNKLAQLNDGLEYNFSREELIAMLDYALGDDEK